MAHLTSIIERKGSMIAFEEMDQNTRMKLAARDPVVVRPWKCSICDLYIYPEAEFSDQTVCSTRTFHSLCCNCSKLYKQWELYKKHACMGCRKRLSKHQKVIEKGGYTADEKQEGWVEEIMAQAHEKELKQAQSRKWREEQRLLKRPTIKDNSTDYQLLSAIATAALDAHTPVSYVAKIMDPDGNGSIDAAGMVHGMDELEWILSKSRAEMFCKRNSPNVGHEVPIKVFLNLIEPIHSDIVRFRPKPAVHAEKQVPIQEWRTGLCDFFAFPGGVKVCFTATLLPCVQYSFIVEKLEPHEAPCGGACVQPCLAYACLEVWCVPGIMHRRTRKAIRDKYNLEGNPCPETCDYSDDTCDCCVVAFFPCCALVQEANELRLHEMQEAFNRTNKVEAPIPLNKMELGGAPVFVPEGRRIGPTPGWPRAAVRADRSRGSILKIASSRPPESA
mmetsp:Transcript_50615/g.123408  ORF Transcript_50615/g.123408 Transcript_50615/m.123408 type:complete len:446 (+) Transcript_50615:138-1475(+)|eukprot:CAMPEP_0206216100 /NCGR_PEP_ID=MMETSP0047_2-20121206/2543_1 /ASSEMBLY_ACC=CAM_ASM_000192 /TAXON_ID=195065 /ORGANISM="Chroomonas mesostigmatica_cf, Strain CCMP1168" /LENGTH=445 /DNA_ID=CAMNT_0053638429 /DNA_START=395 /DNA_END=1732 /DNA_ORIENTATION=-